MIEVPFLRRSRLAKASFRAGLGLWLRPSLLLLCGWARLSAMLAVVAVLGVPLAEAAATTTTLALSASSVASGTVVTFTATVRNPAPVTAGTVTFCNAAAPYCEDSAIIGTAQLTSAGTAIIRLVPGIGSHSYEAVFTATTTNGTSNSSASPQALVVTGLYPTATTIVASGTSAGSNYTLTSTVVGTGSIAFSPTPTVSFLDTSNGNASLGTATLGGSTFAQTFAPQLTSATLGDSNDVAVGDFNQDGLLDVVVLNYYASSLSVFLGAGDGTFGTPTQFPADFTCYSVVVGDFNGDGKLDLAVTNINAWTVSIYLGNGDGTFQSKQDYPVGGRPQGLAVGDFNRDGNLDLAVANTSSASVSILLGDGLGGFAAQVTYPVGNSPTSVAVADFNGDGFPDLAVTNYSDGTQLDASPSVPGTSVYSPAAGTIPAAGTDTLSVTFTPTDTTDYNNFTGTVQLTVNKVAPTITWTTPAAITYGAVLSVAQLDASAVPSGGTYVYTPALGSTPAAGRDTLSVTYTPPDTTDYSNATGTVTLALNQAAPVITWATPAAIPYGTVLSATQLDASAVPSGGTYVYTPALGSIPAMGSDTLSVTYTPPDTTDYTTATATVNLTVTANSSPITPTISWATPAAVASGTALSSAQLNAIASVAGITVDGTFVYTPAAGTIPAIGLDTLTVVFTPTDSVDYATATGSVVLTVGDFFSLNFGSSPIQTVQQGANASYSFTVTPVGLAKLPGVVTFTATGLPPDATITFSPSTVPAGSAATEVAITIHTSSAQAANTGSSQGSKGPAALGMLLLPILGIVGLRKRLGKIPQLRAAVVLGVLSLGAIMGLTGCGAICTIGPQPTSTTYTVVITAHCGALQHSADVTIKVEN